MARSTYKLRDTIDEALRQKYAKKSILGVDNEIIHNIFKSDGEEKIEELQGVVFNPNFNILFSDINENSKYAYQPMIPYYNYDYTMSDGMAAVTKEANLEWAVRELPYASKILKEKVLKIGQKKIDLVVIGYGGAMLNVLWNLAVLNNTFGTSRVFNSITIYEDDDLSLSNMMRMGKPFLDKAYSTIALSGNTLAKLYLMDEEYHLAPHIKKIKKRFDKNGIKNLKKLENPIIIGAPDFETRAILQEMDIPFFFVGHGDNEVSITHKPDIHWMVSETYGTIDVPVLLVNLWLATYKLIDLFSDDVDNFELNQEIFKFNFNDLSEKKLEEIKEAFKKIN